tara:strand:- start:382 stop:696 length:315 start_codon:yes stop_codon:yes gene_type:complete
MTERTKQQVEKAIIIGKDRVVQLTVASLISLVGTGFYAGQNLNNMNMKLDSMESTIKAIDSRSKRAWTVDMEEYTWEELELDASGMLVLPNVQKIHTRLSHNDG